MVVVICVAVGNFNLLLTTQRMSFTRFLIYLTFHLLNGKLDHFKKFKPTSHWMTLENIQNIFLRDTHHSTMKENKIQNKKKEEGKNNIHFYEWQIIIFKRKKNQIRISFKYHLSTLNVFRFFLSSCLFWIKYDILLHVYLLYIIVYIIWIK